MTETTAAAAAPRTQASAQEKSRHGGGGGGGGTDNDAATSSTTALDDVALLRREGLSRSFAKLDMLAYTSPDRTPCGAALTVLVLAAVVAFASLLVYYVVTDDDRARTTTELERDLAPAPLCVGYRVAGVDAAHARGVLLRPDGTTQELDAAPVVAAHPALPFPLVTRYACALVVDRAHFTELRTLVVRVNATHPFALPPDVVVFPLVVDARAAEGGAVAVAPMRPDRVPATRVGTLLPERLGRRAVTYVRRIEAAAFPDDGGARLGLFGEARTTVATHPGAYTRNTTWQAVPLTVVGDLDCRAAGQLVVGAGVRAGAGAAAGETCAAVDFVLAADRVVAYDDAEWWMLVIGSIMGFASGCMWLGRGVYLAARASPLGATWLLASERREDELARSLSARRYPSACGEVERGMHHSALDGSASGPHGLALTKGGRAWSDGGDDDVHGALDGERPGAGAGGTLPVAGLGVPATVELDGTQRRAPSITCTSPGVAGGTTWWSAAAGAGAGRCNSPATDGDGDRDGCGGSAERSDAMALATVDGSHVGTSARERTDSADSAAAVESV